MQMIHCKPEIAQGELKQLWVKDLVLTPGTCNVGLASFIVCFQRNVSLCAYRVQ